MLEVAHEPDRRRDHGPRRPTPADHGGDGRRRDAARRGAPSRSAPRDIHYPVPPGQRLRLRDRLRRARTRSRCSRPGAAEPFALFVRPHDPERAIWVGPRAGVEGAVARLRRGRRAIRIEALEKELPQAARRGGPGLRCTSAGRTPLAAPLLRAVRRVHADRPRTGHRPDRDPRRRRAAARAAPAQGRRRSWRACARAIAIAAEAHRAAMRDRASRHARVRGRGADRLHLPPPRRDRPGVPVHRRRRRQRHHPALHRQRPAARRRRPAADRRRRRARRLLRRRHAHLPDRRSLHGAAQRDLYDVVLAAQQAAIAAVRPGATLDAVHRTRRAGARARR